MTLIIKEIDSKEEEVEFIEFPFRLYANNVYWVPKIKMAEQAMLCDKKNPSLQNVEMKKWLAKKDGKTVGRIAGVIHYPSNDTWGEKSIRFGWFDAIRSESVVKLLIQTVEHWGRSHHLEKIHGPLGFTDLDPQGMLIEGFDKRSTMATLYNESYYPKWLEKMGYSKAIDWVEYSFELPKTLPQSIKRVSQAVRKRANISVRSARSYKELIRYSPRLFQLINEGYKRLYGFVPINLDQISFYMRAFKPILNPDYVSLAFNQENDVVGFCLSLPNLSETFQQIKGELFPFGFLKVLVAINRHNAVELGLIAVDQQNKIPGVAACLIEHSFNVLRANGVRLVETNPELESNKNVQALWKGFNAIQHKRRRVFEKQLV